MMESILDFFTNARRIFVTFRLIWVFISVFLITVCVTCVFVLWNLLYKSPENNAPYQKTAVDQNNAIRIPNTAMKPIAIL